MPEHAKHNGNSRHPRASLASLQQVPFQKLSHRACTPFSTVPRAFLKWAGSKRSLLPELVPILPTCFRTYREPFLGSGSLFFLLEPERAVLSDSCADLIATFAAVRDNVDAVVQYLRPMRPDRERFYQLRSHPSRGRFKRAAEFIYMNKVCWNGLYRVNSQGRFNVPYGQPRPACRIADPENLRACARLLRTPSVRLSCCDFENTLATAKPGDLVYLDPPYVTRHNNNGFVDYNENLFSWQDQERLARLACELAREGVHVIVSNAHHDDLLDLYPGFARLRLLRASTLAASATYRGTVSEAMLYSVRKHGSSRLR
ncbi:MAG: Dam family site-specific DNA-(adenine-N6)-methyltransferase [Planctomycetia bacterium]|nr:Dam family site-specific DNA-(adenine-N6)-methyltransferase [Planctomycetia bacterium]